MRPNPLQELPQSTIPIDILAVGDAPAVVYPASVVGSVVARADMESASPMRQSLRTAADEPQELSASSGVG